MSRPNPVRHEADVIPHGERRRKTDRYDEISVAERHLFTFLRSDYLTEPFNIEEVGALLRYASEQGIDCNGLLAELYDAVAAYKAERVVRTGRVVLEKYTRLCALTHPVTGRNVLSAADIFGATKFFMLTTFVIFVASVFLLAIGLWIRNEPQPDDDYWVFSAQFVHYYLPFFTPFFWGALGSCVFILQRINDEAASLTFDSFRFKGWLSRALLGAVLGGTITYIIDPAAFDRVEISSTTFAFLAGVGTKAVYGGLEKIVELAVEKMNLASLKPQRARDNGVTAFLAQELGNTPPEDTEKRRVLATLLERQPGGGEK